MEECFMASSSRQRASTQRATCEEVFGEKQHSSDGTSTVLSGPSTVRLFPLPENQVCAQRNQVRVVNAVKAKATQLLNSLTQDDLQHCFQQWKIRMERCRDREGDYIEGDNISIVRFFFNKGLEHESGFFIATPRTDALGAQYICSDRKHFLEGENGDRKFLGNFGLISTRIHGITSQETAFLPIYRCENLKSEDALQIISDSS